MQSFAKYLGGSSCNLAAGLAKLGSKSSMLTRVGNEQMGRFVREALVREGVDVSHLVTDPDRLTALVILGISDRNTFPHIFYRENCADMAIDPSDFDEAYIASSRALAITGTHLSTPQSLSAVDKAVEYAEKNDTKIILDIDYRPVLWGLTAPGDGEERYVVSDEVTQSVQNLVARCDLVVGTEEEIHIAGGSVDTLTALKNVREKSAATIVLKRGPMGCTIFEGEIPAKIDDGISVAGVTVEVLNTLGAGDAFLSGFLSAWLKGESWEQCAISGNACGALVVSRHACSPAMPGREELDYYLAHLHEIPRPDKDIRIGQIHNAKTRRPVSKDLCVLAFDHRRQLEDLVVSTRPPQEQIASFKALVSEAFKQVASDNNQDVQLGIIVDERYGEKILADITVEGWWIGRPVEVPSSRPLELDPRNSFGLPLLSWPASHVVKCLVFYHPSDPIELRLEQESRVRELHADCVALDRELMLEIIATSNDQDCNETTISRVLTRFYNLGIRPAWWKLETQSRQGWQNIQGVINRYDPLCNGVLLLGLDAPENELLESFAAAEACGVVKGFAVGRSIFGSAARQWFSGEIDNSTAVCEIASNYKNIMAAWIKLRSGGPQRSD